MSDLNPLENLKKIQSHLKAISVKSAFFIKKQIQQCKQSKKDDYKAPLKLQKIENLFKTESEKLESKKAFSIKDIHFDSFLPVCERRSEILELIKQHQVVIVAGETGSGKTTQLPKMCLELGLGLRGMIGHTQPRRLAARAVAQRIADELHVELGTQVGYKVRFNEQMNDNTFIKLMTDGILLTELQHDKLLLNYDTIIIDEAHERSLNIDFILGYLKQILPKRPDLKVIITSATIDLDRFSKHFNNAPIIEVSGRTYPVEVRYRPVFEHQSDNEFQPILDAVDELLAQKAHDILIFLTGEKEIRDVANALEQHQLKQCEIVPLYARLSHQEQNRIFQSHSGRRIVLATNVAETSLTIPNIDCVIDTGFARISRYSARTKIQRLPIEPISQAAANQRKGRCGRVSNGICIRLYSEEDFNARPLFTDPEILRTNLASVILKMHFLKLGDVRAFPFIEAPEYRLINDGNFLLKELNAIQTQHEDRNKNQEKSQNEAQIQLTEIGMKMALLPVDPKLARMLVEANQKGCLREVMIIISGLSIQDPREYPLEKQQAAKAQHARYQDKHSDFVTLLNLWHFLSEQKQSMSGNQLKQFCRKHFLNYLRLREWQEVQSQIHQLIKQLNFRINQKPADNAMLHQALLSGLLSSIGQKELEGFQFLGARHLKFSIFPNSALFKQPPKWIMVNELIETTKLWGSTAAKIEPEWIEPLALHLVKRSYSDPHWSKKAGCVQAKEKVMLYGLPIVQDRTVALSLIDPPLARELFIQQALVAGDWQCDLPFFKANQKTMNELIELEHKTRKQNILISESSLFERYDRLLPNWVCSTVSCQTWWKKLSATDKKSLFFTQEQLTNSNATPINAADFPDEWLYGEFKFKIQYHFDINQTRDGVTVDLPLILLNQIDSSDPFTWQVPGFRLELIVSYIKSLPKSLRRHFVPAPNYAQAFLEASGSEVNQLSLMSALERFFKKISGIQIEHADWQLDLIPDYLKISFRILDAHQKTIAQGKDLDALKKQLEQKMTQSVAKLIAKKDKTLEKTGLTQWNFGDLPKCYEQKENHYQIKMYPTLVDKKQSVSIELVDNEATQMALMQAGLRRLLFLDLPSPIQYLHQKLPNRAKLGLYFAAFGKVEHLIDDCIECALDALIEKFGGISFNQQDYVMLLQKIKPEINEKVCEIALKVEKIAVLYHSLHKKITQARIGLQEALSYADIKAQLQQLVYPGFIVQTGEQKLSDVLRYLQAIDKRLEKINAPQERANLHIIEQAKAKWQALTKQAQTLKITKAELDQVRFMIEELRINLFAQQMKTAYPISLKRIEQHIQDLIQSKT